MEEKLTKSRERVKKYAEVYTPRWVVDKMCDLLEQEADSDAFAPEKTFLEPSCGNGNFLVVILARKLAREPRPSRLCSACYAKHLPVISALGRNRNKSRGPVNDYWVLTTARKQAREREAQKEWSGF